MGEQERTRVKTGLARRVDLSQGGLSYSERQRFEQAVGLLQLNSTGDIQDWLQVIFRLNKDKRQWFTLDGDISVEMTQWEDLSQSGTFSTIIRIHNILLPRQDSNVVWKHLVRPKAEDPNKGTLKFIINSRGGYWAAVEKGVVEQQGYKTDGIATVENLAAILAKVE
ncbi:MAG: hypothetical protein V1810_03635 [Candidatus Beckwithbacteria bacterium]